VIISDYYNYYYCYYCGVDVGDLISVDVKDF